MDIKEKLTAQEKQRMGNLALECQVLNNLAKQQSAVLQETAKQIFVRLGMSPETYFLKFNAPEDVWNAELRQDALIIPNREMRRKVEREKN